MISTPSGLAGLRRATACPRSPGALCRLRIPAPQPRQADPSQNLLDAVWDAAAVAEISWVRRAAAPAVVDDPDDKGSGNESRKIQPPVQPMTLAKMTYWDWNTAPSELTCGARAGAIGPGNGQARTRRFA